tara:strand:+ start:2200 stop:2529 length:330 start_codon:yes stop_codon:yes gene_type:complete
MGRQDPVCGGLHEQILSNSLSPFEKFISKNDIFCLRFDNFMFIDNSTDGENDRPDNKYQWFGRSLTNGEYKMVRSFESMARSFAAVAINVVLLVAVGAGMVYAVAPTIA